MLGTSRKELSVCHSQVRFMYRQPVLSCGMMLPCSSTLETR